MEIKSTSSFRPAKAASSSPKRSTQPKAAHSQTSPRLDIYRSSEDRPFGSQMLTGSKEGLLWDGTVPPINALKITDPKDLVRDNIPWEDIKRYYTEGTKITLDSADSLESSVNQMTAIYVAAKKTLESTYSDQEDKLSENMEKLNAMFAQAKSQMVSSYQNSVGRFYENTGNKGISSSMGKSLSDAIDERVKELETTGEKKGLFEKDKDIPYSLLQIALIADSFVKQQNPADLEDPENASRTSGQKGQNHFTLKELQAAGFAAKAASKMNPKELLFLDSEELGLQMSVRYMKMAAFLDHSGIDKEVSSLLLGSFDTYLNQYSGKALSDKGSSSDLYQYALKLYESTKDISKVLAQSGSRYMGDRFFSEVLIYGNGIGMSRATRYNLDISQFQMALKDGDSSLILQSIAGNKIYPSPHYA